ncbi:hypothetical protein SEA_VALENTINIPUFF_41 [Microbacterium phage ValentiniPuff]|uniref:Uncharacterized protein n=1 Tax=Microbacterium phage ValentiniPuff TaxID=2315705 RepID=A0A386KPP9_9CAUD|nr:hypothetical protein SEA_VALENTINIPUFF_41 [Microbacterium phage ValentiniPuff]
MVSDTRKLALSFLRLPTTTQRLIVTNLGLDAAGDDRLATGAWRSAVLERVRRRGWQTKLADAIRSHQSYARPNVPPADDEADRIRQQNDVSLLILTTLGVERGRFMVLTQRVEIADALWAAGYRKVVD